MACSHRKAKSSLTPCLALTRCTWSIEIELPVRCISLGTLYQRKQISQLNKRFKWANKGTVSKVICLNVGLHCLPTKWTDHVSPDLSGGAALQWLILQNLLNVFYRDKTPPNCRVLRVNFQKLPGVVARIPRGESERPSTAGPDGACAPVVKDYRADL
jgi:hypothetical protein